MLSRRGLFLTIGLSLASGLNPHSNNVRQPCAGSCNKALGGHKRVQEGLETGRRRFLNAVSGAFTAISGFQVATESARAAVGSLPEFRDTNAIVQGVTVNVADKSQQDAMIDFLVNGFDFKVLRKRISDSVEDTVGDHKHAEICLTSLPLNNGR